MRVFLTGGTGFIGQELTKTLLAAGWAVTALVRKPTAAPARALSQLGATCVAGDVTERDSMRAGMLGADLVLHNAGHYEYGLNDAGRQRMQAINVQGTANVLGLALELGIPRSVYVSSTQAIGETGPHLRDETYARTQPCRTWYEQTKTEAHAIARQFQQRGLPLMNVCPHGVIGPNDHSAVGYLVRLYLNGLLPPLFSAPEAISAFVHVEDLAVGIRLVAEQGQLGETYLLTGEPKSMREHLACWFMRPGGAQRLVWLPPSLLATALWPLEPVQRWLGLPAFMSRETVWGGATYWNYSSHKAQSTLGWQHRSAQAMWLDTLDGELELLAKRKKRDWVARLKPVEVGEVSSKQ